MVTTRYITNKTLPIQILQQYYFDDNTTPQIKVFTQFSFKFFRYNYQLLREQQDQQAYTNFPQILTEHELLPYIISNKNKHLQYRDLTSFNTTHLEPINFDHTFLVEHSDISDNRPFTTSNNPPETTPEE